MAVTENDLALDRELAEICGLIPLLRLLTPTNVPEARDRFFAGEDEPDFEYRQLPDLKELKERVNSLTSLSADDPVIAHLAEALINELNIRLHLLAHRNTEAFFLDSIELFGNVEEDTLDLAHTILAAEPQITEHSETISAEEFAQAARNEISRYRKGYPEIRAEVIVSESTSGVMVEGGNVYIGQETRVATKRVTQLLQHEIGTHVVTFENGLHQPLHILSLGLAHYDELQEALGVLAEHLAGGLQPARLRLLAYRVVAAQIRSDGSSFRETFKELSKLGCSRGSAFTTTMRAYRAGGMTKDAIYLRGLARLVEFIASGGELEPLFIGKISFEAVPLISDLRDRAVLADPPLKPRFLDFDGTARRLSEIKNGLTVIDLGAT
jgi:uncharacterized protein (TIGR02421 family)